MICPRCKKDLGEGLLPARCPSCGQPLSSVAGTSGRERRTQADHARASRKSVEGLSGRGAGKRDRSIGVKRSVRLVVGFAIVVVFCVLVYTVAYRAEIIGGRSVPNVVGWSQTQAENQLASKGFSVGVNEVSSTEQVAGRVVSTNPPVGSRAPKGSTVTIDVVASTEAAQTEEASGE